MAEKSTENRSVIAVRIRGTISARREMRETLRLLHLTQTNHAVLIRNSPSFTGMLNAVHGYVTWGEASKETVTTLISTRGRLSGNKNFTAEYLRKIDCKTIGELADAVFNCQVEYWKLPNIQPAFRLHPPTKGFRGNIKKSYRAGGELGYRGEKISELVRRMI